MILNHLAFGVSDAVAAESFYQKYFGFRFAYRFGNVVVLMGDGGFRLALEELKAEERFQAPASFHFGFCVKSAAAVRELYEHMQTDGVEFVQPFREHGPGAANFYCRSPGDYPLEVFSSPPDAF